VFVPAACVIPTLHAWLRLICGVTEQAVAAGVALSECSRPHEQLQEIAGDCCVDRAGGLYVWVQGVHV
jgi:hypothetical protein